MLLTPLYHFQKWGTRRLNELNGRALLADEVGLGKTIQALYYSWRYLPTDPPGPIVVLCPSHLKIMWSRQAEQHLELRVEILNHQRPPIDKLPPHDPNQTYVINYEILTPPHWKKGTTAPKDSWLAWLAALKPRLVIGDEIQRAKTPGTAVNRACEYLAKRVPHFIGLSGTPLPNKPKDLWAIIHLIDPRLFPSQLEFLFEYTHMRKKWYGWESKGAKNLDKLHEILMRRCMIRRRKADVLKDLPSIIYDVIPVEIDMTEYRRAELDYIGWLEEKSPQLAARARQAEELVRLNGLKQLAGKLKVNAVVDWAEELLAETGGKLLLGCVHHEVARPLMRAFGGAAVLVNGQMNHEVKQAAFDRFNRTPDCRVLVGNLQAAGTGWSCTSTSDVAVCEMPWVPSDLEQFTGRVHGIERGLPGATSHVRLLVAAETIEDDICSLLQQKRSWAARAIDGTDDVGEFDLHDKVKSLIKKRHAVR